MWNWIVENIATIKDLLWIVFTFVATVVAILTYKRARYTLLQPLKSEVIKRQTELLIEVLDFFDSNLIFSAKVDYMTIVSLNMYKLIEEFGFVLNDDSINEINEKLGGALFTKNSGIISSIEKSNVFDKDTSEKDEEYLKVSKQRYEDAKSGKVTIDVVYVTKNYIFFSKALNEYISNPFMPQTVKILLEKIKRDINYNLTQALKNVLEEFVIELCSSKNSPSKQQPLKINADGLYNVFNRQSIHHQAEIDKIKTVIREYLMIDKKWN